MAMATLSRPPWRPPAASAPPGAEVPCFVRHSPAITAYHALGPLSNDLRIAWNGSAWRELHGARRTAPRVSSSSVLCAALGGPTRSDEERWQREEARWLREEQRWLRQEARWNEERQAWAQESEAAAEEVGVLRQETERLRRDMERLRAADGRPSGASLSAIAAGLQHLLHSLTAVETNPDMLAQEPTSVSESTTLVLESRDSNARFEAASFSPSPSIPSMSEFSIDLVAEAPEKSLNPGAASSRSPKVKQMLKKGAEGEEVQAVQDALAAIGFHSGEEEMEYSLFSSDTEMAVKTWQAAIGALDDGVVSPQLAEILFGRSNLPPPATEKSKTGPRAAARKSEKAQHASSSASDPWTAPAVATKGTGILAHEKTFAEEKREIDGTLEQDIAPNRRVFLLGENRWEEPGRLIKSPTNGEPLGLKLVAAANACLSCCGKLVTMCTVCEGTGDLNVEDQFMAWVEDGAKCPYCEGSGAVPCDMCS